MNTTLKRCFDFFNKHALWFILFLALLLRLYQLDATDLWYDEAFTAIALKESFADMMAMVVKDVHPPLYYILAKPFASLFGYSVFGIRFFSLVFGMLGILGIYLFSKEFINQKAALFAVLLTAISPFAIQYSQEARMYTLLSCLLIFSSYFFLKAFQTKQTSFYLWWGMLLGLAYLTHYLAILFAPIFYVVFLVWKYNESPTSFVVVKTLGRLLLPNAGLLLGYALSGLIFLFWIPKFLVHLNASHLNWIEPAKLSDIFLNLQIFILGIPRGEYSGMPLPNVIYGIDSSTVLVVLAIFFAFVIASLWKTDKFKTLILLVFSLGFIVILYVQSLFGSHYLVARYILPSAYFVFIILGFWFSTLRPKAATASLLLYVALLLAIIPVHYFTGYSQLSRDAQRFEGKTFYLLNSFDYVIAKSYFGSEKLVLYNIDWPQYDSSMWAAIGPALKRTEDFETLKNDENGFILYNTAVDLEERSDKSFDPSKFNLVSTYDNISVYESKPKN